MRLRRVIGILAAPIVILAVFSCGGTSSPSSTGPTRTSFGKCVINGTEGQYHLSTATPGTLTGLLAGPPGPHENYIGTTLDNVNDGEGYCMLANIAYRAGLSKVSLKLSTFETIVAGAATGYDICIDSIFITDARKKVVDFTVPYEGATTGVMVLKSNTAIDQQSIHQARIGVTTGSVQYTYATQSIKSTKAIKTYDDAATIGAALKAGQVDVELTDLPIALAAVAAAPDTFKVVGQYDTGTAYGGVLPKGSANAQAFDAMINAMISDGTIKALIAKFETAGPGLDPTQVPIWTA
jgi:polar amino acid transport system substrate-binding protein